MPKLSHTKLTKRTVEAAVPPQRGDRFVWDSEIRGFGLRLYASGRRLFLFQYQAPATDTTRRLALGEYPAITVDQARQLAQRASAQIADDRDPKGDDTDQLLRRTIAEVFPEYLAERSAKVAPRTAGEWTRVWKKDLAPAFGKVRVSALDEATVARWHSGRQAAPVAANRAVETLRTFCNWAERRGYRPRHSNPCTNVERFEEARRSRSLTVEEYRRLGEALDRALTAGIRPAKRLRKVSTKEATKNRRPKNADTPRKQNATIVAALRFLVLSGWREQEALTLRWDSINFERGVAVLVDTKTGRSERPLGGPALEVLRGQARVEDNPFVFVGERPGSHVAEPKRVWQSVMEDAGLETMAPLRLHDLRHSFTTVARDEMGLGDHIIARLIGHTMSGQTSRYGEVRDQTVRSAATKIAETISGYLNRV